MLRTLHGRGVRGLTVLFLAGTGATLPVPLFGADEVGPQMRAHVEKARSQVGDLKPWQEEAFQGEVLPSSGRFVKDYSSKAGKITRIDIDFEAIRRYLSFHSDQILKQNRNTILAVRASEGCTPCVGAVPFIRRDLQQRLERRGFKVVVLSAQESARDLTELLSKRSAAGWVSAVVNNLEDPDHPGDFKNELLLEFRFPGSIVARVQKQMETLPQESVEVSMSRLAVDAFTEMGSQVRLAKIGSLEAEGNDGVEISVTGITSFSQLLELKKALQAHYQTSARVVERRIQRGSVALAVVGEVKVPEVARAVQGLAHSQLQFKVISTADQTLQISATPRG